MITRLTLSSESAFYFWPQLTEGADIAFGNNLSPAEAIRNGRVAIVGAAFLLYGGSLYYFAVYEANAAGAPAVRCSVTYLAQAAWSCHAGWSYSWPIRIGGRCVYRH